MNDYIYTTQRYEAEVPVDAYLKECVDVPTFLEYCKQCPNYGKVWSCPPYDFSPEEYWKKYRMLHLISVKINFPEEMTEKKYTQDELAFRANIARSTLGNIESVKNDITFSKINKLAEAFEISLSEFLNF